MPSVLETFIRVGAAWTGAAAMAKAASATKKVESTALLANLSLRKMVGSVAALAIGYKGLSSVKDFIGESIQSAKDGKKTIDDMVLGFQRIPAMQKLGIATITEQTNKFNEMAKAMENIGVLSQTTLMGGFAKLAGSGFSPDRINKMSGAFADLVVRMKGMHASASDAAEVAGLLGSAIKFKMSPPLAKALGLTMDQSKAFNKVKDANQRYQMVIDAMNKKLGDNSRAMETSEGIQQRYANAWDQIKSALGKPFLDAQDQFAKSATGIVTALQPLADLLAGALNNALQQFVKYLTDNQEAIKQFGVNLTGAFQWVIDNWQTIQTAILAIAAAFVVLKAALGIADIIGKVGMALQGLQLVFTSLPAAIGFLTNPITLTIIALVALSAAIYFLITHWEDVKKAAQASWEWIQGAWGTAASWFQANVITPIINIFRPLWEPLVEPFQKLWASLQPIFDAIGGALNKMNSDGASGAGGLGAFISNSLAEWNNIVAFFQNTVAPLAQQAFNNWLTAVGWVSSNIIAPIITGLSNIISKLTVGDLWGAFSAWVDTVRTIDLNIIQGIVKLFQVLPGLIGQALVGVGNAILSAFQGPIATVTSWVKGIGDAWNALTFKQPNLPTATPPPSGGVSGLGAIQTHQMGGLVSSPTISALAERGIPEMIIPIQGTSRSRGLLSSAASMIGMQGVSRGGKGGGDVNVSVNAPITINGAAGGQEGAIGREVQRAMQDPIRQMLEQLRKAKQEEQRLSYA